jgi:membrane protease YdiL (CAAX protease family)
MSFKLVLIAVARSRGAVAQRAVVHRARQAIEAALAGTITTPQHTIPQSVMLHLAPGVATLLFYIFVGNPIAVSLGYPSAFGFALSTALILVPIELGTLAYLGMRLQGRLSLEGVVLYRQRPPRRLASLVAVLLIWSVVVGVLASPLDAMLRSGLFGWVPDRFLLRIDGDAYSLALGVWMYVGLIAMSGIALPVVEELYFRGFLLPRLSRLGIWAPILEMALFALYHLWSPWLAITRFLVYLPTVYAVWRTGSVVIAIWVHCLTNSLGAVLVLAGSF